MKGEIKSWPKFDIFMSTIDLLDFICPLKTEIWLQHFLIISFSLLSHIRISYV